MLETPKIVAHHIAIKITNLRMLVKHAKSVVGKWDPSLVINAQPLSCSPFVCFGIQLHPSHLPPHGAISKLISLFRVCFCMGEGFGLVWLNIPLGNCGMDLGFSPHTEHFFHRSSHVPASTSKQATLVLNGGVAKEWWRGSWSSLLLELLSSRVWTCHNSYFQLNSKILRIAGATRCKA